jgi:hypothetical protein
VEGSVLFEVRGLDVGVMGKEDLGDLDVSHFGNAENEVGGVTDAWQRRRRRQTGGAHPSLASAT